MEIFQSPPKEKVIELLEAAKLPTVDISDELLQTYIGCGKRDSPYGLIGIEVHGDCGLLRSLVVSPERRSNGCGKALVLALEAYAADRGIKSLYLLTETAEEFFSRLGYRRISRAEVPASIQGTREFSSLCPSTATAMWKPVHES